MAQRVDTPEKCGQMLEQRQHRAQRPSFDKNRSAQPRFCASVVVVFLTHFSHQLHTIEYSCMCLSTYMYLCVSMCVFTYLYLCCKYIGQFNELNFMTRAIPFIVLLQFILNECFFTQFFLVEIIFIQRLFSAISFCSQFRVIKNIFELRSENSQRNQLLNANIQLKFNLYKYSVFN